MGEQRGALDNQPHPFASLDQRPLFTGAEQLDRSVGRKSKSGNDAHQRRFSGSVLPNKAIYGAFTDRQIHFIQRYAAFEIFRQLIRLQYIVTHCSLGLPLCDRPSIEAKT
ncbi:hypothetical protein D3C71_1671580 [compost metagenome]